jgi:signal peptide peptidase SppA
VKAKKPVVVSMGGVAASGGYMISAGANKIFAEPTTITGSIGIFGLLPNLSGLVTDKLGVTFDEVTTSKYANFEQKLTLAKENSDEMRHFQTYVDRGYITFLDIVAKGRKMTRDGVNEIAQGRVWIAGDALKHKLIDNIGSLDDAIAEAAKLAKTKEYLKEYGIQYFGSYEYTDGENNCGIVVLPINAVLENGETEQHQMPFGFCSAHGVFGIPTEANRANVEKHAQVLPTVVMPHMGAEYQTSADQLRQNLYREYINRGADAVIGDHPHTIQNVEAYNGRLIVYSMGNFMFDQATMETARSAAIDAAVSVNIDGVDFEAWDKLAQQCEAANGMCYDLVAAAGLPKLQLTWKYDYRGTTTDYNTLIPHAANESESVSIGQRLNWAALPAELKQ